MEDELNELLVKDPRLAHGKVVVLNFAKGGTKQPQNATALAYFLSIGQRLTLDQRRAVVPGAVHVPHGSRSAADETRTQLACHCVANG
jgi:hypothetical protein